MLSTLPISDRNSICTDAAHFDVPAGPNGPHHDGQRRVRWRPDQVIGQFVRVVEATTKDEPMATVYPTPVEERQAGPIKASLAFGSLAGTESVPVLFAQRPLCDAGDIGQQEASAGLY